jgi:hypothetical protein
MKFGLSKLLLSPALRLVSMSLGRHMIRPAVERSLLGYASMLEDDNCEASALFVEGVLAAQEYVLSCPLGGWTTDKAIAVGLDRMRLFRNECYELQRSVE